MSLGMCSRCFHSSHGLLTGSMLPFAFTSIFATQNVRFDVFSVYLFQKVTQSLFSVCTPAVKLDFSGTVTQWWCIGPHPRRPPTKNSRIFVNTTFKVMQLLQKQVAVCHFKVNAKQLSADRIHPKSGRTELHIPLFLFFNFSFSQPNPSHYVAFKLHSQATTTL